MQYVIVSLVIAQLQLVFFKYCNIIEHQPDDDVNVMQILSTINLVALSVM